MSTPPPAVPRAPVWPYCGYGAGPADPVGCRGIHVPGGTACLAHLSGSDRDTYLAGLAPGADIDHRGTPFTEPVLDALLNALRDPSTGRPHFGAARFGGAEFADSTSFRGAIFSQNAQFEGARFSGSTWFDEARFSATAVFPDARFSSQGASFSGVVFSGIAWFGQTKFFGDASFSGARFFSGAMFGGERWSEGARFSHRAMFTEAIFSEDACFSGARFAETALFKGAEFSQDALFDGVKFSQDAVFERAKFSQNVLLQGAEFSGNAWFGAAKFEAVSTFGPVVCTKAVDLSGAVFEVPVILEIAAGEVRCMRTLWESTVLLRVRYAAVDLSHAVLALPAAVTAHPANFTRFGYGREVEVDESLVAGDPLAVRIVSVQGVDVANLVLTDTDLTDCLFFGAIHLDQLCLAGSTSFALAPTGWHRRGLRPVRWTRRRTLAEEHHWRAQTAGHQPLPVPGQPPSPRVWRPGPHHPNPDLTPDPEDVAALYRQLRKSFEDGKNEPGAADFYYGEMEMRRHDRTNTSPPERRLLLGYWMVSGYGLRASRALGWLGSAMLITIVLLMGFGLPKDSPKVEATGAIPPGGGTVTFEIEKQDVQNPAGSRFTGRRFEKALNVTLNSVVFRSSGEDLTTAGTYIEMASRFLEPSLIGLAILAVRGRIKR